MNSRTLLSLLAIAPLTLAATAMADQTAATDLRPAPSIGERAYYLDVAVEVEPLPPPPPAAGDEGWQLSLSIPAWIPAVDGNVTVKGTELSPSQDTGDTIDIFDSSLDFALALHIEARKGRFGLFGDVLYLDLAADNAIVDTDTEFSLKGFIGELGAFYVIVPPDPAKRGWGRFRLDALGGVRVSAVELGANADTFGVSANQTVYDPIVGARAELGLTNWLSLKARGDVGGFGIEAWPTSDFSWNVDTRLEFHLAEWFDLGLGYRWLKYDFVSDSGTSSFDATISGPVIELKFNF